MRRTRARRPPGRAGASETPWREPDGSSSLQNLDRLSGRRLGCACLWQAGGEEADDGAVVGLLVFGVQPGDHGGLQLEEILAALRSLRQGRVDPLLLLVSLGL